MTIALIDLDHFKSVNDKYGHAVGDYVLKEFARLAGSALRASDTLGRWGGEEFLLILPDAELDSAVATIHRIRSATAHMELPDSRAWFAREFQCRARDAYQSGAVTG